MERNGLLFIVTDGLNEKQSECIDQFVQSYGFRPEYVMFEFDDLSSEVNSFRIVKEKTIQYEKENNKKPYFLFAVEHGTYFITRTVEEFGIQNIIHIDHQGVRFAY